MTDSVLVPSALRGVLYRELGEPAADFPNVVGGVLDDKIQTAARKVLAEMAFARNGKGVRLGTFQTVAGQQTYPVNDNEEVVRVFWGPATSDAGIDIFARQFASIPGSSLYDASDPGFYWDSDRVITNIRRQQITGNWKSEVLDGEIYLFPVPTDAQTVRYLYYLLTGEITDLTVRHQEAVVYYAAALCCRVMGNRLRGRGTTFTGDGIVSSDKSLDWREVEDRYMNQFLREITEITSGPA